MLTYLPGGRASEIIVEVKSGLLEPSLRESKMKAIRNFLKEETGASAVEYGLLVALIAAVIIVAVGLLGTNLSTKFNRVATSIGG
jgi:pilus assembly protein Flp/PilA